MTDRRDVIFTFSTETLSDAVHRGLARPPDRMLQTLARSSRVGHLMVVDAERWLPALLRRGRTTWPSVLGPTRHHIRPWRLGRGEPSAVDDVIRAVNARADRLRKAAARKGFSSPSIVTFDPLLAGLADFEWARSVTYYGRDDWAKFPPREAWWPAYEEAYAGLRQRQRGVLAISAPLLERIDPTGPAAVIPNGIEPAEWRCPQTVPGWFETIRRPVQTYVGTVDDRVDETILLRLAAEPGTVLLMGPCPDPARQRRLAEHRLILRLADSREELAAVVYASDVGLIPHVRNDLTTAMSPLKLYEYRAAGLPVATVDLPPVTSEARHDPRIVVGADGPDGFAAAVGNALAIGRDNETDRLEYVEASSWASRHKQALDIALR